MENSKQEFIDTINSAPLPTKEHMFSKGTLMPFNCTNSGIRKLMFSTNLEQRLALCEPDVPYVSTGFETQFGQYSSSYQVADKDYTVLARIPKFSTKPYEHYYLIMIDETGTEMSVIERSEYQHVTESFGYIYNNTNIDVLHAGDVLNKGTVIHRSKAFDGFGNRMDGKNLLAMFNSSEYTTEDSIVISESASKKLASPLIRKVDITLNANDIPLNIFGTPTNYKIIPDIGEETKDDILCAVRREKKEEALFSQSYDRLNTLSISDEKIMCSGRVVDIDVYSNDPSKLEGNIYFNQIKFYWNQQLEFSKALVDTVKPFIEQGVELDYDLQKLYYNCSGMLQGKQYFNERVFSNLNIDITVIEEIPVNTGDKCTNRYGGKGVVSEVRKDYLMPKTYNGETFDALINICGVYGRENGGQLFEATVTAVGRNLLNYWSEESLNTGTCFKMYLEYLKIISPSMYEETLTMFADKSDDVISEFIGSMVVDGEINVAIEPMSENMTIDKVAQLYRTFPWMDQEYILVPLPDSNGNIAGFWGVMTDIDEMFLPWNWQGKYMAGCEVEKDTIVPKGWSKITIPAFKYISVKCKKDEYQKVFEYITNDYLPKHKYNLVGAMQEFYDAKDNYDTMHLLFPIEFL